jgi:hypothetical protein
MQKEKPCFEAIPNWGSIVWNESKGLVLRQIELAKASPAEGLSLIAACPAIAPTAAARRRMGVTIEQAVGACAEIAARESAA